jgi:hypothetical protein
MIIVLACEGPSEVFLIHSLIQHEHLSFPGDLFLDGPIVMRQISKYIPILRTIPMEEDIEIWRIGDTQKDKFSLKGLELRENHIRILTYCTKPEIESLVIINEGLWDEYLKQGSRIRPKAFIKQHLKDFSIKDYFETHDMYDETLKYKKLKRHRKGELFLADLL